MNDWASGPGTVGPRAAVAAPDVPDAKAPTGWRGRLAGFLESAGTERAVAALIVINAAVLGLETSSAAMAAAGGMLAILDRFILALFVIELACRMTAHGSRFFRDPWSLFDFVVVGLALVPATGSLSALRALRVLRVLRLMTIFPRMRGVVRGLLMAIPGVGSIVAVLGIIYYVAAVIATKLFGDAFPELFGTLGESLFSLFQVMTLEGWPEIVREVMTVHPRAWIFFLCYILVATFTMLNLFIAVMVNAMQAEHEREVTQARHSDTEAVLAEIAALRAEVRTLRGQEWHPQR
jgi:voltage-gated sodium channel